MSGQRPAAVLRQPPDELMVMAVPAPPPLQSDSLLDAKKTGWVLLFSGLLLALLGVAFTIMGWYRYQASSRFDWTQLLGPILISVGGTFMLTSFSKLSLFRCQACEEVVAAAVAAVRPTMEQTTRGHPRGRSPTITLHCATTMVCIPPTNNMVTQEVWRVVERQPGGAHVAPPPPCGAIYYVDNGAFTAEEEGSADRGGRYFSVSMCFLKENKLFSYFPTCSCTKLQNSFSPLIAGSSLYEIQSNAP
uniref:Transmembrane protein 174 n=1 Tax=Echeneis naucrates TaxID=173247 RepID=A0A665W801_ECHNA